jgi:flagellar motor switch protein FliM
MAHMETTICAKPLSIDAIRAKSETSTSNLAMIPKCFGRFVQILSGEIASIAPTAPNFSYEGYARSEVLLVKEQEENSSLSELLVCSELQQCIRVNVDRGIIYGICDVVFGGVGNEAAYAEARPFSRIEHAVVGLFFKAVGRSMPLAFTSVDFREFFIAPLQGPEEDSANPPFKPAVCVKLLCNIHGYSGDLTIELPNELAALFKPEDSERNVVNVPPSSEWGTQISGRVEGTEIELTAVLSEFLMSLDGVTSLYSGQLIRLENHIASPLMVYSEGVQLFSAKLGQTAKRFCLSIDGPVTGPL